MSIKLNFFLIFKISNPYPNTKNFELSFIYSRKLKAFGFRFEFDFLGYLGLGLIFHTALKWFTVTYLFYIEI